jgi:hypothetical protein
MDPSGVLDDELDGGGETVPLVEFVGELFLAGFGEGVELGNAAGFGGFGFGFDPALLLEAVEGWVERALLHLKDLV